MKSLVDLQRLYDRNRYLEAFQETAEYWSSAQSLDSFSSDELIFAGRLAFRLGGSRMSRRLFRKAIEKNPNDAQVRYFTCRIPQRGRNMFEDLRRMERNPELDGADPDTQASWLAFQGVIWARVRDFSKAHRCIERAHAFSVSQSWVLSCESDIYSYQDLRSEALDLAEKAWSINPGVPYAAHSLGQCLVNLSRVEEAAERLEKATEGSESVEVLQLACWHLCTLTETLEGARRIEVLNRAKELAGRFEGLAPLADRETRSQFARAWLDIAELEDDHEAIKRWAREVRSPFHRKVLANLEKNPDGCRIRLPFRRAIQKHDTCLPTSVASALGAMGVEVDADAMASEITFGGTAEWAAAEWLEKRGLTTRFFPVTTDLAALLIKQGFAFVMTLEADDNAHAVAIVGIDEAAGTLFVHDPQALRTTEYLLEHIGEGETPLGPKGMAIVPLEKANDLDRLLPQTEVAAMTATEAYHRAGERQGHTAASEVVAGLVEHHPDHAITRLLKAIQAIQEGRLSFAQIELQTLLATFPNSAIVRLHLLSTCRALGNTALMREVLEGVVKRGLLPGVQSRQDWVNPPSRYVTEYADILRLSAETREEARQLLNRVIKLHDGTFAQAWHVLGDLLWDEYDVEGYLLAYRLASCLSLNAEHYARSYCEALGNADRKEEGLAWLEKRVHEFEASLYGESTRISWISALENWGYPERAIAAFEESLAVHGQSAEFLGFAAPFAARMGQWEKAESLLQRLENLGNPSSFHEAALYVYRSSGQLDKAIEHAERWVLESPMSFEARKELAALIEKRDGTTAATERTAAWLREQADHDEFERLYCGQLDRCNAPHWKKYALLRRRVKRNPEDGWAWRELTFDLLGDTKWRNEKQERRSQRRLAMFFAECERTGPESAATQRIRALRHEARGKWDEAVRAWLTSIRLEPGELYGYQRLWDCLARFDLEEQERLWKEAAALMRGYAGRLSVARSAILFCGERFGMAMAEETVQSWRKARPDDPELVEAFADLLLERGQGRTDAERASEMLRPAVDHYPFHVGLRFSLASAQRTLGQFEAADETLQEIVRRKPDYSAAQIQLARVHERHKRYDEALRILEVARKRDPRNTTIYDASAQVLIAAGRHDQARELVAEATQRFPGGVNWRERAIELLKDCGDEEAAIRTAREGIEVYPRGAYLWLVLGRTLLELPRFAKGGEVEQCFRRSLELNKELFGAADRLAILLVEQRRHAEAEEVVRRIEGLLPDPTPAKGRLAWIHRDGGKKTEARSELTAVVSRSPWYSWGWNLLIDWMAEDKAWNEARSILRKVPEALRADTKFRRKRLSTLEEAGLPATELDQEWMTLLHDFPEDIPLHLIRYDSLRDAKRMPEAATVLEIARNLDPQNPYARARSVEVLSGDPKKHEEAIEIALSVLVADREESVWPVDFAWQAIEKAKLAERCDQQARKLLEEGQQPTPRALFWLAKRAANKCTSASSNRRPVWRTWFPDEGAREILALLKLVDSTTWATDRHRAVLLERLNGESYHRNVARYWRKHKTEVESGVESWAQAGRALVALKRERKARELLGQWQERAGVRMWMLANYVMALSPRSRSGLKERMSVCEDALRMLPHDHCAKYLLHVQAEACALLGEKQKFLEVWNANQDYFDGKVEGEEWFETKSRHLLGDLTIMARALQRSDESTYNKTVRSLRWERFRERYWKRRAPKRTTFNPRWIWLIVSVLWLLMQLLRSTLEVHR